MSTRLGLRTGVALVVSNMVGAGVFLSEGYMAQDMGPGAILLAWVVGAVLALAGTVAYAQAASWVPRSGGEYRLLSDLLHPALGYLAGWASLLVGFSAPIAINALAGGAFAATLWPALPPRVFACALIVSLTAAHAAGLRGSQRVQALLTVLTTLLLAGFVVMGLTLGETHWPTWEPPSAAATPFVPFMASLFFVAFAFSGWNAAVYVASEFEDPLRDVPRAMLIGCGLVALLYLAVNWIFVANLTPADGRAVFDYEEQRVTLGHVLVTRLLGVGAGRVMSVLSTVAFAGSASAMLILGPRVYAAMAGDGFLPRVLAVRSNDVPVASVLLQGAASLLLVFTHTLQQVLSNAGALLTLFAALVSLSVLRRALGPSRPPAFVLCAAALHAAGSAWCLYYGLQRAPGAVLWLGLAVALGLAAFVATRVGRTARTV